MQKVNDEAIKIRGYTYSYLFKTAVAGWLNSSQDNSHSIMNIL